MAKLTQKATQYETPQITPDQLSTETFGGMAPSAIDVVKSANARAQKRHEMKRGDVADQGVLPDSAELAGNELVGIRNNGYLAKKGLEFGVNALYNTLPPGMDIEDQENSDIREMQMVVFDEGIGYPGDGWAPRTRGAQMTRKRDMGRPEMTNASGGESLSPRNPRGQ